MVVHGTNQEDASYRIWNGSAWSGPGTITAPSGVGQVFFTTLASDPTSDRLALGVIGAIAFGLTFWLSARVRENLAALQTVLRPGPASGTRTGT